MDCLFEFDIDDLVVVCLIVLLLPALFEVPLIGLLLYSLAPPPLDPM